MRKMVKVTAGLVLGGVLVLGAAPALAQGAPKGGGAEPPVKSKFYNFEDMLIDGEYKKPGALLSSARDRAKFERLFRLRKSFLQTMLQTAKEPALRK